MWANFKTHVISAGSTSINDIERTLDKQSHVMF